MGLRQFYRYVVNIGRWSPYEGGQLDRFYCINNFVKSSEIFRRFRKIAKRNYQLRHVRLSVRIEQSASK
jgi:hypothetical protein